MTEHTAQHTPGPWRVAESQITESLNGDIGTYRILNVAGHVKHMPWDQLVRVEEANARLIAAAPRMLAFIRYVLSEEGQTTYPHPDFSDRARAILRDVEGESNG